MLLAPTRFDLWFTAQLADFLGRHPLFDLSVQSAIYHHVLGGFWYAAALFVLWLRGGQAGNTATRRRILTILLGSLIAILLIPVAQALVVWPPPIHYPSLSGLYPRYIYTNPEGSSFPSQSVTLYASLAAGIYSLHRMAGWFLWVAVVILVGLPRIYVGGHYPSDVFGGIILGVAGYATARYLLESRLVPQLERVFVGKPWLRVAGEVIVFAWILQVAIEFQELVWLRNCLRFLLTGHYPKGL
jgi:membrane-associated phospholipid phosphatase